MPNRYSEEIKKEAVKRWEKGGVIKAISQELNIPRSTIYRWSKTHRTIQTPQRSYTPAEFDALLRRVKKSENMLEVIRRTECINEIPLQTRLAKLVALHEQNQGYSVHELCEALEVARETFYNSRSACSKPGFL